MVPTPLKGPHPFTYWDYRAGMFHQNKGMRIDLVYATAPSPTRSRDAYVDREARKGKGPSDHAPIVVDARTEVPAAPRRLSLGRHRRSRVDAMAVVKINAIEVPEARARSWSGGSPPGPARWRTPPASSASSCCARSPARPATSSTPSGRARRRTRRGRPGRPGPRTPAASGRHSRSPTGASLLEFEVVQESRPDKSDPTGAPDGHGSRASTNEANTTMLSV